MSQVKFNKINVGALVEKTIALIKQNRNVVAVYLYGSYAKAQAKILSDVDLAVLVRDNKMSNGEIASYGSELIHVEPFHVLSIHMQFEIIKYGIPLYIADKNELDAIKADILFKYHDFAPFLENYFEMSKVQRSVEGAML